MPPALAIVGCPAVLKTAAFGYDGKGQVRIDTPDSAPAAWRAIGGAEAILEAFVDLERERVAENRLNPRGDIAPSLLLRSHRASNPQDDSHLAGVASGVGAGADGFGVSWRRRELSTDQRMYRCQTNTRSKRRAASHHR